MKLLVDAGNSRIKWSFTGEADLSGHGSCAYSKETARAELEKSWEEMDRPGAVYVANVAGDGISEIISDLSRSLWRVTPVYARVRQSFLGLENCYEDINQLGVDRWLAMLAGWHGNKQSLCLVSCGTAVTIDFLDGSGRHLGGVIVPGHRMMQDSLINGTVGITARGDEMIALALGKNTRECVVNGATFAITSVIENMVRKMETELGQDIGLIITGGDAEKFHAVIDKGFILEPYLILKGLDLFSENQP